MTEWIELKTLQDIAKAQADGWEIERKTQHGGWVKWHRTSWHEANTYRARPSQPKMDTVKMQCWIDDSGGLRWVREWLIPKSNWIRVPLEDKTIEIPDS